MPSPIDTTRSLTHATVARIAGLCVLACTALPALAQRAREEAVPLTPPTPGTPDDPPMLWNVLITILLVAIIIGASLIPSKRGHQD